MYGMQGFNETTGYEKIRSVQVLPQEIFFFFFVNYRLVTHGIM